ncbi:hypothetical protein ZWY2020_052059 [Hordeum vulgare]|nr:hypothetical protein ZWY2020_052059 [Hordeum vulgare]
MGMRFFTLLGRCGQRERGTGGSSTIQRLGDSGSVAGGARRSLFDSDNPARKGAGIELEGCSSRSEREEVARSRAHYTAMAVRGAHVRKEKRDSGEGEGD